MPGLAADMGAGHHLAGESKTMTIGKTTCPICNEPAAVKWVSNRMMWVVTCAICTRYTIDDYLMNAIELAREQQDEASMKAVSGLSFLAQETTAGGGRLDLSIETFLEFLHDARRPAGRNRARRPA